MIIRQLRRCETLEYFLICKSSCRFKKSAYLCSAFHLKQAAESPTTLSAAFFMPLAYRISSVPCGALMRPQPESGGEQRGAELFLFPLRNNQYIVSF